MQSEFNKIRQALEEHLNAINENTSEIQVLFDYLSEMEMKIEKVTQRVDQLQLTLGKQPEKNTITPLNHEEKKVFLTLYTEEMPLSYFEIATKSSLGAPIVAESISSMITKGVPFHRTFVNSQVFFKLQPQFKELQAKENVVNLSLQSFL